MKYLLLVHHNEEAFNTIPEDKRKDMLADDGDRSQSLQGRTRGISQWQSDRQVSAGYVHSLPLDRASREV
jgi:hypothetical protein